MAQGSVVKFEDSKNIVFEYKLKDFPLVIAEAAHDFISGQEQAKSDFKLSDIVAQQSGIARLKKDAIEEKIEETALARLKDVEERAYKEAYELGVLEGAERAFQESKEQFQQRLDSLDNMMKSFENLKLQLIHENEAQFIKLVYHIAKRIAMKEIQEDKENTLKIINDLATDLQSDERILVKVSNEDMYFLETLKEKAGKSFDILKRIKLEADDHIKAGGVIVETNYGTIDATIEERVERAWGALVSKIPKLSGTPESGGKSEPGAE